MFALWPGEWLNFSNFKLQRLVSGDNARLRKPATSQTQTLFAISADEQDETNLECTNQDLNLEKVDQL
jgi:hypothetical protein